MAPKAALILRIEPFLGFLLSLSELVQEPK